ncbi:hypothetical protein FKM82_030447 [Ascaphus truei]
MSLPVSARFSGRCRKQLASATWTLSYCNSCSVPNNRPSPGEWAFVYRSAGLCQPSGPTNTGFSSIPKPVAWTAPSQKGLQSACVWSVNRLPRL